jgi:hypothetical protein
MGCPKPTAGAHSSQQRQAREPVKLISIERGVQFGIVRNDSDGPYSDFTIRAEIQTAFGRFSGENTAVHLSAFDTFLEQFDVFLKTRQGEVVLTMTEDNAVTFFRWNAKGDVGVRFTLCRYTYVGDPARTCPVVLQGEFPLAGEYLLQLRSELATLVDP